MSDEKKLRKKIIRYYIICALGTSVLWSALSDAVGSVGEKLSL